MNPMWEASNDEDVERIQRYNIFQMAKLLHKSPEEIESMDYSWYRDAQLFEHTEQIVAKIKQKK